MGIAAYNRGTLAISDQITQESQARKTWLPTPQPKSEWKTPPHPKWCHCERCDVAPDGGPWITREPNRQTPHAENGWQYHYE